MALQVTNKIILIGKGIHEIDQQIKRLRKLIGPVAAMLGKHLIDGTRRAAISQLEIVLECAVGYGTYSASDLARENMAAYEASDMFAEYYNHAHDQYNDLKEIMFHWFAARISATGELFSGNGADYKDLVHSRFSTKEDANTILGRELSVGAKAIIVVEKNPDVLKLPFGLKAHKVIDYMKQELDISLCRLSEELDKIYSV